jgi:hypothetical protein
MDLAGQRRNETPRDDEKAEVERRAADIVEEQIGRHLHENIADEKDGKASLILAAVEVKILLQTLETCRCIVVADHDTSHNRLIYSVSVEGVLH